ncbi:MAG: two-component regulator propeller domain-containing protein [Paludibacteraceae bacterium]
MKKNIGWLLCSFFLVSIAIADESVPHFIFEQFPINEKLPSNSITRIYNDGEGYMWFGTKDGLCRYDGYDIKIFRSSALTPGKLTNNEIECIEEDNQNRLWIGTYEGINIFDKKSYSIQSLKNKFIEKERINHIFNDSKGHIWIGTSTQGVICINSSTGEFERFSTDADSRLKLQGNNAKYIYEDKDGIVWIMLWKAGLCAIDQSRKNIFYAPNLGVYNNPFRMMQDRDGLYWICTWGDGMYHMSVDGRMKIDFRSINYASATHEKPDNIVYGITQDDKFGYIWVLTFKGLGLIKKDNDNNYLFYGTGIKLSNTDSRLFHDLYKDRLGNMWLGTVGDGLYLLDFNKLSIQNYPLESLRDNTTPQSFVSRLCNAGKENVYAVINRFGLVDFNLKTNKIQKMSAPIFAQLTSINVISHISKTNEYWLAAEGQNNVMIFRQTDNNELVPTKSFALKRSDNSTDISINVLYEDLEGTVWIGTSEALYKRTANGKISLVSAKTQYINTIEQDLDKNIWVGTERDGLFVLKYNTTSGKGGYSITKVDLNTKNYRSLSVQTICCRKNGEIYIGTKEGCLFFYNQLDRTTIDISGQYGISEERILDIIEDNFGYLWISTAKRIIRYNPLTHASTYYTSQNGVGVSTFYKGAFLKLSTGQLLFGGNNGIVEFNPTGKIPAKKTEQQVAFTDILIQNSSIFDDTENKHFNPEKNQIRMKYSENNISIEFAVLNQLFTGRSQYAYKLSGIDKEWNYVGNNRRYVNYVNLPSGNYTFLVKASDENGLWSRKATELNIHILPPIYRTWWAYLLYMIAIIAIGYTAYRIVLNRIRLRNDLAISRIEKEKSEELTQIKLKYFTNITHELLTPLTIIMLQVEKIQKKMIGEDSQYEILKENVSRLNRLIKQILAFRKTESGNMKLKVSKSDIVQFVYHICKSNFRPLVNEKEINFIFDPQYENYSAYFDSDKLDKIIYNLLSNAFKHTPAKGSVAVKMSFFERNEETILRISIADSGNGIAEEDIPHIFQRFYISSTADQSQSNGIGLSLTYDLVQLHKGAISVKSQLGEGAVFTVEIPVSKGAFANDELAVESDGDNPNSFMQHTDEEYIAKDTFDGGENGTNHYRQTEKTSEKIKSEPNKETILIVEDNRDLRNLMFEYFSAEYNVLTAENGLEALTVVNSNVEIELIISDVMMPKMDGLTLCSTLKNDIKTSHINVLLLTAKNSTQDRIDSYNAGADSYIAKPFESSVLDSRVKNLLKKRQQKMEDFQKSYDVNISSMEYSSMDEQFLKNAVQTVEEKLADDSFNFDEFATDMASAKSTLHRKLKSLTGLSPGEFIRNIRLKHAARMLENNTGTISEIAFAVGFNDPKYFSRCFKNEFGMTPKEYQNSKKAD